MTDAFTTAARAEAEEYAWDRNAGTTHEDSLDRDAFASGYEYGAIWARDHLAAQEPTEEEVEAAARAVAAQEDRRARLKGGTWWGGPEYRRKFAREDARAALTAAKEARHG